MKKDHFKLIVNHIMVIFISAISLSLCFSFYAQQPKLSLGLGVSSFLGFSWVLGSIFTRSIERMLTTQAGIKWDLILIALYVLVSARYAIPLIFQEEGVNLQDKSMNSIRWTIYGVATIFAASGARMAREIRMSVSEEAKTTKGSHEKFDWHGDVGRYQVPFVLFALALTLFQMIP